MNYATESRLQRRIGWSIHRIVRRGREAFETACKMFITLRVANPRSEPDEATHQLIQRCLKRALYVIHALEQRAPQLWAKEAPAGLYGQNGMISLVTQWLQGASIPFSTLEERRVDFAEAVEAVRHAEVGLDGEPLTQDPDQRHPERAIGGLIGSAVLILVTAISCLEVPSEEDGVVRRHSPPNLLRDRITFAERELQQALDRLHELEVQHASIPSFESLQVLILGEERLSTV